MRSGWTAADVRTLHERCGIYTTQSAAEKLLDWVSWTDSADLRDSSLLEPSCGDGALLLPAVERLCRSFGARGMELSVSNLGPRITAYEIHSDEAAKAKHRVGGILRRFGVAPEDAKALAKTWILTQDFLLQAPTQGRLFSHVVANPPYVRWSALPAAIARKYERQLRSEVARGDLCLAFVDGMLAVAQADATIGLLASDRWLYAEYATEFRRTSFETFIVERHEDVKVGSVFSERVSAYPAMFLLRRRKAEVMTSEFQRSNDASTLYADWSKNFGTLTDAGCSIHVGPALGHEPAFVLKRGAKQTVEQSRQALFVGPREVKRDAISWSGRSVAVVHGPKGLVELAKYPKLAKRLQAFKDKLKSRSCVSSTEVHWYRTIDRIVPSEWATPKLLIPELALKPRVAIDDRGFVPSHGIYAIFPGSWPVKALYAILAAGVLGATLHAIAPKVNGGCLRCYKKFLLRIPLPAWAEVEADTKEALSAFATPSDAQAAHAAVAKLYTSSGDALRRFATEGWLAKLGVAGVDTSET